MLVLLCDGDLMKICEIEKLLFLFKLLRVFKCVEPLWGKEEECVK